MHYLTLPPRSAATIQQRLDFSREQGARLDVVHMRLEHDASLLIDERGLGRSLHTIILLGPLPIALQRHEPDAERRHHFADQAALLRLDIDRQHDKAAV